MRSRSVRSDLAFSRPGWGWGLGLGLGSASAWFGLGFGSSNAATSATPKAGGWLALPGRAGPRLGSAAQPRASRRALRRRDCRRRAREA